MYFLKCVFHFTLIFNFCRKKQTKRILHFNIIGAAKLHSDFPATAIKKKIMKLNEVFCVITYSLSKVLICLLIGHREYLYLKLQNII